jgi:hypothetical protein
LLYLELESKDINFTNKRKAPHHIVVGLIGPKSEFGPLRPMCILMRYGKFSTTSLAKGGGRPGAPHKRNTDPPRARAWIKRRPMNGSNSYLDQQQED